MELLANKTFPLAQNHNGGPFELSFCVFTALSFYLFFGMARYLRSSSSVDILCISAENSARLVVPAAFM